MPLGQCLNVIAFLLHMFITCSYYLVHPPDVEKIMEQIHVDAPLQEESELTSLDLLPRELELEIGL